MVVHYKCPGCGSDMAFDSHTGKLSCSSCGHEDNIETFSNENIVKTLSTEDVDEYHCENCGSVLLTDKDTAATTCSFCGAGVVLSNRLSGTLHPSYIIPFSISKEEAVESFKKWCKNGLLTPKGFMDGNRIKEMKGLYVPFWMYDMNSEGSVVGSGKKVKRYTQGDYIVTETSHYELYREVDLNYIKVPVDASDKMNDELMDKLEPYNYEDLKDFKMPYLAGSLAEKYNSDEKESYPRVQSKVEKYARDYVLGTMSDYSGVRIKQDNLRLSQENAYYVLLPVWVFNYDLDRTDHVFAMNGQTGKVVGKPPISWGKVGAWFGGISLSSFILLQGAAWILGGGVF